MDAKRASRLFVAGVKDITEDGSATVTRWLVEVTNQNLAHHSAQLTGVKENTLAADGVTNITNVGKNTETHSMM